MTCPYCDYDDNDEESGSMYPVPLNVTSAGEKIELVAKCECDNCGRNYAGTYEYTLGYSGEQRIR